MTCLKSHSFLWEELELESRVSGSRRSAYSKEEAKPGWVERIWLGSMRQEVQQEKRQRYGNICHQIRTTSSSHHQFHKPRCIHFAFLLIVIGNMLFFFYPSSKTRFPPISPLKGPVPAIFLFLTSQFPSLFIERLFRMVFCNCCIYSLIPFLYSQVPNSTTQLKLQLSRPMGTAIFAILLSFDLYSSFSIILWLITPPFWNLFLP